MTDQLFTSDDLYADTFAQYEARLTLVSARIDSYHADCWRRAAMDERRQVQDRIKGAHTFLDGGYDSTYAGPHPALGATIEDYRAKYAGDALRTALHHLVWAERYAGLRTEDSARELDPYRR